MNFNMRDQPHSVNAHNLDAKDQTGTAPWAQQLIVGNGLNCESHSCAS